MERTLVKSQRFYVENSEGQFLQSRNLNHEIKFAAHKCHATWSFEKGRAERLLGGLQSRGIEARIVVDEYEFYQSTLSDEELEQQWQREKQVQQRIEDVSKLDEQELRRQIAELLGWEGEIPDWPRDIAAFFRTFTRWSQQAKLDFVIESYPDAKFCCSLLDKYRTERDTYGDYLVSGSGMTISEAGCRAWLKALIGSENNR